jgi:hypothetical protein
VKERAQMDGPGGGGVALVGRLLLLGLGDDGLPGRWREDGWLRLRRLGPATSCGQDRPRTLDVGLSWQDRRDAS